MLASAAVPAQSLAGFGLVALGLTVAVLGYRGVQQQRVARRRVLLSQAERDAVPVPILDRDASPRHFIDAGGVVSLRATKPTITTPARA